MPCLHHHHCYGIIVYNINRSLSSRANGSLSSRAKRARLLRLLCVITLQFFSPTSPQFFTPLELTDKDVPHTVRKVRISAFQRYAARFCTLTLSSSGSVNVRAPRTKNRSITFFYFLRTPTNIAYTRKLVYNKT